MDRRSLRDLDILTLQLFVAICEEGTLTRAAKREAIAPSAVSKRLADLENAVKAELFYRGANGMTLTSAGETVLRYSRRMLENIESIGVELKEYARGVRGFVRLRANLGAIVQFLPDDLGTFLASHPEIMVDLGERSSRSVVDEVERGIADIGLCSSIIDPAGWNEFCTDRSGLFWSSTKIIRSRIGVRSRFGKRSAIITLDCRPTARPTNCSLPMPNIFRCRSN